ISVYTLKWYSADNPDVGHTPAHVQYGKGGVGISGKYIFIKMDQIFLISADGVSYRETIDPADQMDKYLADYKRAATEAFKKALVTTCIQRMKGKGMMQDYSCDVRGIVQ